MKNAIILVLLFNSVCLAADIYSWVDENGVKHFSNQEPAKAKSTETFKAVDRNIEEEVEADMQKELYYQQLEQENRIRQQSAIEAQRELNRIADEQNQKEPEVITKTIYRYRNNYRNSSSYLHPLSFPYGKRSNENFLVDNKPKSHPPKDYKKMFYEEQERLRGKKK